MELIVSFTGQLVRYFHPSSSLDSQDVAQLRCYGGHPHINLATATADLHRRYPVNNRSWELPPPMPTPTPSPTPLPTTKSTTTAVFLAFCILFCRAADATAISNRFPGVGINSCQEVVEEQRSWLLPCGHRGGGVAIAGQAVSTRSAGRRLTTAFGGKVMVLSSRRRMFGGATESRGTWRTGEISVVSAIHNTISIICGGLA